MSYYDAAKVFGRSAVSTGTNFVLVFHRKPTNTGAASMLHASPKAKGGEATRQSYKTHSKGQEQPESPAPLQSAKS